MGRLSRAVNHGRRRRPLPWPPSAASSTGTAAWQAAFGGPLTAAFGGMGRAGNGTPVKSTSNAGQVYGGSLDVIV